MEDRPSRRQTILPWFSIKWKTPPSCHSRARPSTQIFVGVKGASSRKIYLVGNELHDAAKPFEVDPDVNEGTVKAVYNF